MPDRKAIRQNLNRLTAEIDWTTAVYIEIKEGNGWDVVCHYCKERWRYSTLLQANNAIAKHRTEHGRRNPAAQTDGEGQLLRLRDRLNKMRSPE